jgi:hypothetical protein
MVLLMPRRRGKTQNGDFAKTAVPNFLLQPLLDLIPPQRPLKQR